MFFNIVIYTYSIYNMYIYIWSFLFFPSYINRLKEKNISPVPPCADFTSARRCGSGTLDLTRRDEVAEVAGPGAAGQKL